MGLMDKLKHAWNAFISEDGTLQSRRAWDLGNSNTYRPDRVRFSRGNEKSIITAVYNRLAIDVSTMRVNHVRLDADDGFKEIIDSELNYCLTVEANKDQQTRAFFQDVAMSLFDEGSIAIVPIDTNVNINKGTFDILSMRTGKILQWFPDHIEVEVYNDRKGIRQNLIVPKKSVAIIENPHYAIMNERNSVLQRLIRKLNILDAIDEQSGSGKLDLIIQLPYVIKTEARRQQAENRRKDVEDQLAGSKYGIAYTDGTEKITQLNRSVENNLLKQIEYLTSMLYSQLGFSTKVLDGTASEQEMLNYRNSTLLPVLDAIVLEINRKFLTKTARTQKQAVRYFTDPSKLLTFDKLSEFADKFTRNEILTSNEVRQMIGIRPSSDPKANELRNKNLNPGNQQSVVPAKEGEQEEEEKGNQNGR